MLNNNIMIYNNLQFLKLQKDYIINLFSFLIINDFFIRNMIFFYWLITIRIN